ncbi:MAG: serine/threonine protein kinase [Myxococcales bacterium]|nr:serine/threonine protein kinase [Myxococcales bacterium]
MRYVCPECDREFAEKLSSCPHDGAPLLAVQDHKIDGLVGTTLDGRFRVDRLLGQGGMGAVYAGEQTSIGRTVAIKVIKADVGHDAEVVKRFHREAKIISQLAHGNVVQLIDFGQTANGLLYLVMELVNGRSLHDEICQGPMDMVRVTAIGGQICDALAQAHSLGVVHRDLKPDNILLTSQPGAVDVVKILDFGIAKVATQGQNTQSALTLAGAIMGTPLYMSPEQIDGSLDIGPGADLYALAVIIFEMVAGAPPFQDEQSIGLLIKHLKDRPPLLKEVNPGLSVPAALEAFVRKGLSKDPDHRCGSALAFKAELATAVRGSGLPPSTLSVVLPAQDSEPAATLHGSQVQPGTVGAPVVRQTALGFKAAAKISGVADPDYAGQAGVATVPSAAADARADATRVTAPVGADAKPNDLAGPDTDGAGDTRHPFSQPTAIQPYVATEESPRPTVAIASGLAPSGPAARSFPWALVGGGIAFVVVAAAAAVVATDAMRKGGPAAAATLVAQPVAPAPAVAPPALPAYLQSPPAPAVLPGPVAAAPAAASPSVGPEPAGPEPAGPEPAGPEPAGPEPAGPVKPSVVSEPTAAKPTPSAKKAPAVEKKKAKDNKEDFRL